jgi:hypothetical protein
MRKLGGAIIGLIAVSIAVMMLGSGSAAAASASGLGARNGPVYSTTAGASCSYVTFVYYATSTYDGNASEYGCTLHATDVEGNNLPVHDWSNTIFEVYCIPACQSAITIADYGYAGDYYSLWVTDDSTLATDWALVGTTPQVTTSSELNASAYNSHWTGTGSKYSTKTFYVYDPSGVAEYFAINDGLMGKMTQKLDGPCGVKAATLLSSGCSVSGIYVAGGWSPAGFDTTWTNSK